MVAVRRLWLSRQLARGAGVLLAGCVCVSAVPAQDVQGWLTTSDRSSLLAPLPPVALTALRAPATGTTIVIDTAQRYQVIEGFGAALTDAAASLIQTRLSPVQREALLQLLFGRKDGGAGFSLVRITLGASDFSLRHYTFDDRPAGERDDALTQLSIAPHQDDVIPLLKRALAINPQLQVMATPWSAPAWMKTPAILNGGTLRPDAFATYARYLVRVVDAYARTGVPIALLSIQNEPHHEPKDYPGMRFMPAARAAFIGEHLGPLLAQRDMKQRPRLLDWDHNWDEPDSPLTVLRDARARPYVAGVAWHCYAGDVQAQSLVHDAFPDTETWFTECAGGAWAPDFGSNLRWNTQTLIIGATRHWARGVMLWNLALDPQGNPHLGGCGNCRGVVTVDAAAGTVTLNEEYYALAHASRFVRTGAVRVGSTSGTDDLHTVAFRNPDGTLALITVNAAQGARTVVVRFGTQQFVTTIPAGAVTTHTWPSRPR